MQSGAGLANDRLVLVLLNIPPAFQPMLDLHTSCWAGEDQYCHQPSLQVGANQGVDPAQNLLCGSAELKRNPSDEGAGGFLLHLLEGELAFRRR
jgi:hypothetical protein